MALGLSSNSGEDFLPICKYDARAGRFSRVDRVLGADGWGNAPQDITDGLAFLCDFSTMHVGWIGFPGGQPSLKLVPIGSAIPSDPNPPRRPGEKPGERVYKPGFRVLIKLSKASAGDSESGGALRHFSHSARVVIGSWDSLHDTYLAEETAHPGQVPIVSLTDVVPVKSKNPGGTSTNYAPVFEISGWADRPQEFIDRDEPHSFADLADTTGEDGLVAESSNGFGKPGHSEEQGDLPFE